MNATNSGVDSHSALHFRRLYEEAPLPYQSLDSEGRLLEVNRAWEQAFGYKREEVLGRFIGDFHVPGREERLCRAFEDFLSHGSVRGAEFEFLCKDGARKLMSVCGRIVRDDQGRFLHTHCILNDITGAREIENALKESEEKYRLTMEATRDGLWDWDLATGRVFYSPGWSRILGEKGPPHAYSAWEDRIHPEDKPRILESLRAHLAGDTAAWQEEHRLRTANGSWIWVLGRGRAVKRDRNGEAVRMVGTITDIDERRRMEESLRRTGERLKALINATTDDVVVLLDADFRMQIVNDRAANGFGKTVDQMIGYPLDEFMPPSVATRRRGYAKKVIESGEPVRFEDQRAGRWYDNNMCPVFDDKGNAQAVAIFARDITARKKMEQALAEAKETAEKANRAKSRFLAAANHDLRQPLQAIRLLLESLSFYRLESPAAEAVNDMQTALRSMELLLNALLDISKLEAGSFIPQREDFNFVRYMNYLRDQFRATATAVGKNVRVYPSDAVLHTDPTLLARILQNFVSNAIRHTKGNAVLVGCRRAGDRRRIEVWDNGPGIAVEQQDKIFEEFYQIGNPERNLSQGLGLGLAIAKRMADLLEIPIGVRSTPSKGSVFWVEVPLGGADQPVPEEVPRARTSPGRQGVILVVEDDQNVLKATRTLLGMLGHSVLCASTAEEALDLIEERGRDVNIALLDYRLPNGWDGVRLLQAIRTALDRDLPAVLLSGDTSINRLRYVRMSGLPLLHKPVDPATLRLLLEQALPSTP
jgi:PAS domain S-box-containing protein